MLLETTEYAASTYSYYSMSWGSRKHKLQKNTELNIVEENNDNWDYSRTMAFRVESVRVAVCMTKSKKSF